MRISFVFFYLVIIQVVAFGQVRYLEQDSTIGIENEYCQIVFDRQTGRLCSITNRLLGDNYLKEANNKKGMPFRIYLDLKKEFELSDEADAISESIVRPMDCNLVEVQQGDGLTLRYICKEKKI